MSYGVAPVNNAAVVNTNHLAPAAGINDLSGGLTGLNPYQVHAPEDPALKVYKLFESGRATAFLKDELNQSIVGRSVNIFCTKAHALYQIATEYLFTLTLEKNPGIAKRALSLDCGSDKITLRKKIEVDISFDVEMNNSKCERLDPSQYTVEVWSKGPAIKKICNILKCAKDKFSILQELIPCVTAPKIDRKFNSSYLIILDHIPFKYFEGYEIKTLLCSYRNHSFHNSSPWQYNQVINTLADSLHKCEQDEIEPQQLPISTQIGIVAAGCLVIPTLLFSIAKLCGKREGEQQPLIAQA